MTAITIHTFAMVFKGFTHFNIYILTYYWTSYNKPTQMHYFLKFILEMKLNIFRTVPLSIIKSFFTVHTAIVLVYVIQVCRQLSANLYDIYIYIYIYISLLCVQWKTPDDGQRNCPKYVEFHSKNNFEKLVHLVCFITRILPRCTVTWTSNYYWTSVI
jgi:hypothetical protein